MNRPPHGLVIHDGIAVYQNIAQTDDATEIWNLLGHFRRHPRELAERLADDFELTLDGGAQLYIALVVRERPAANKRFDVL